MTKEEIKKQALKTYILKSLDVAETITRHIAVQVFTDGAEWMQEQMIDSVRQYVHSNWVGGDTYVFDLSDLIKSMKGE